MVRTAEFRSEFGENFPNSASYKSDYILSNILCRLLKTTQKAILVKIVLNLNYKYCAEDFFS